MFSRGVDVAAYMKTRRRTFAILEHLAGDGGDEFLKLAGTLKREFTKQYAAVLQFIEDWRKSAHNQE